MEQTLLRYEQKTGSFLTNSPKRGRVKDAVSAIVKDLDKIEKDFEKMK
ncbi:hypothetical protein HYT91_03275 [Candidatus Pacearchaeota archaeon]|nr:hypothetical protein [Candidatus Pacearchaeota archaeon]